MLKNIIKLILPKFLFVFLGSYYKSFLNSKSKIVDKSKIQFNEEIFKKLGINLENLRLSLQNFNIDFEDCSVSWHYHLFIAIDEILKQKNINVKNILEIGTYNGEFTNFISKFYSHANIETIDLPDDDPIFNSTYGRDNKNLKEKFLAERNKNLLSSNINFTKIDSTNLLKKFENVKFDIIWIDGDHRNPQVTIDIINSIQLTHNQSIICVDDICMENYKTEYFSNESYITLEKLERNKILKNNFIFKRTNLNQKYIKYISFSTKT